MPTRRRFLKQALFSALLPAWASAQPNPPADRIVAAVMGVNDRGMDLAAELLRVGNVELRYLADPDTRLFAERAAAVEKVTGKAPQCVQDYRRILEDKEVDVIAIATPDHWHALATIQAAQAGKDVYVEKPTSHSIWESRKMVEAARKYNRIVQVGTQNRSAEYVRHAIDYAHQPAFGDIHFLRVMNSKVRPKMDVKPDGPAPEGVDYDLWLGPSSERPFNENHFHYQWHWFWEYGGGDLANDGVHQIDLARWMLGKTLPRRVTSTGNLLALDDQRDTPDTQTVTWEFDGATMALEQTLWTPYMTKTPVELRDKGNMPSWPFNGTRVEIYGTKQFMCLGRMGDGWQAYDENGKSIHSEMGQFAATNTAHMRNFLDCVRTRKRPNADIEEGHYSTLLAHYGNIAYRTGSILNIDPATETIRDNPAANALVKRAYRAKYAVPETV